MTDKLSGPSLLIEPESKKAAPKKQHAKIYVIFGYGDIGQRLRSSLLAQNNALQVFGIRRSPCETEECISVDIGDRSLLESALPPQIDTAIVSLTPDERSDEGYRKAYVKNTRNIIAALAGRGVRRLIYISSTSVYAQNNGERVDELSPTLPTRFSGRRLLEAEQLVESCTIPSVIVRFSGIYGPGRNHLIKKSQLATVDAPKNMWTNRIHADDCAAVLAHLCLLPKPQALYLASDCGPAAGVEVLNWLAKRQGFEHQFEETGLHGGKRCDNRRLLESGFTFKYRSYHDGYRVLLDSC